MTYKTKDEVLLVFNKLNQVFLQKCLQGTLSIENSGGGGAYWTFIIYNNVLASILWKNWT